MQNLYVYFLLIIVFGGFSSHAKAAEDNLQKKNSRELKTLILIIATDNLPAYRDLQKVWQTYMNSDPDHYEAFFVKADPSLSTLYVINKNEIIVKTTESYAPGIINKTILALEAIQPRLQEFDYILRTNLSSFFPLNNLTKYLTNLPREKCYCGISLEQPRGVGIPAELDTIPFISGAAIILSRDIAELLVKDHHELEEYKAQMPDDVFLGLFYQKKIIPFISAQRWDYPTYDGWILLNHKIEDYAYHFRAKNSYNFRTQEDSFLDELLTLRALLKRYYSIELPIQISVAQ